MIREADMMIGQSLWMDDHYRAFMHHGILQKYIEDYSVTGLSVNANVLKSAAASSDVYDRAILRKLHEGLMGESLACSLVQEDTRQAADMLRPIWDRTDGVDGWAMLPASPILADDPDTLTDFVVDLHQKIGRPNILMRLPIIPGRIKSLEELVYRGIPVNATNIFTDIQYEEVAGACLNGIRRRIEEGLKPVVPIFIYIGIHRFQSTLRKKVAADIALEGAVGMANKIYQSMRRLHSSSSWEGAYNFGAKPLRLVWNCSCGVGDSEQRLALAHHLRAPFTIITLPQDTISAFAKARQADVVMPTESDCDAVLGRIKEMGVNVFQVTEALQHEAVEIIRNQWILMLEEVARKSAEVSHKKA